MAIDPAQVVVLNESANPDQAGDLTLFKTISDAERYVEPIDVENREYFAYLLDGRELNLLVINGRVCIELAPGPKADLDRIRSLLEGLGKAVLKAQKHRGSLKTEPDFSAMSNIELAKFIGFS
jgi:hypothetical protein